MAHETSIQSAVSPPSTRAPVAPSSPAGLRLVDTPKDDGVTALRVETKYAVPHADTGKLRTILAANCRRIVHASEVSHVHSIYFDDHRLTSARENLGGADRRTKIRLRWYDSPLAGKRVFLEFKRRINRMTAKDRFAVEAPFPVGGMDYEDIRREIGRLLPERFSALWALRGDPILVNTYRREHFAVPGTPLRLTLDYDIVCYEQAGRRAPDMHHGLALDGYTVIEAKAPSGRETELPRLLYPLRLRVTRSSKYVRGCLALGLAAGTELDE